MRLKNCLFIFAVLGIICCLLVAGCSQPQGVTQTGAKSTPTPIYQPIPTPTRQPPGVTVASSYNPHDYFPDTAGTEWVYKIKLTGINPLIYRMTFWNEGEKLLVYQGSGILLAPKEPSNCYLKIRIKSKTASPNVIYQYPKGVQEFFSGSYQEFLQLEILRDDLNVFQYSGDILWGEIYDYKEPPFLIVHQIVFYPNEFPMGKGSGSEDGFSIKMIFDMPGASDKETSEEAVDILKFDGTDTKVPGYEGIPCLHFLRSVKERNAGDLGKAFSEDTWYAPDKGLVRLEQKVNGQASMTWTLENFKES